MRVEVAGPASRIAAGYTSDLTDSLKVAAYESSADDDGCAHNETIEGMLAIMVRVVRLG